MKKNIKKSGVYKIFNIKNNRIYIGSSINVEARLKEHKKELKANRHENDYLQNDYNKCGGAKSFQFELIEACSIKDLLLVEQKYIDIHFDHKKQCYNILPTAGSNLGYKHTEETKLKISRGNKGLKRTKETKELMSQNNGHQRKVNQYKLNGEFIKTYKTLTLATTKTKIHYSKISMCCVGTRKSAGGFMWRYFDDEPKCSNKEPYKKTIPRKSNYVPTAEHRRKTSQTLKGRTIHPNTLARLLNPEKNPFAKSGAEHPKSGKKMPKSACEAIAKALKGKKKTKEHCENLSKAHKGYIMKEETKKKLRDGRRKGKNNPRARKVAQYDKEGTLIKVWDYMSLAAEAMDVGLATISQCCSGRTKSSKGFIWKFVD